MPRQTRREVRAKQRRDFERELDRCESLIDSVRRRTPIIPTGGLRETAYDGRGTLAELTRVDELLDDGGVRSKELRAERAAIVEQLTRIVGSLEFRLERPR